MSKHDKQSVLCLDGKKILVTGVSRSMGIGTEITRVLARNGAQVLTHGFYSYDQTLNYPDADRRFIAGLAEELTAEGRQIFILEPSDLALAETPEKIIEQAVKNFGYIDGLVLNHAYSTSAPIGQWTAGHIDAHLQVNIRAAMLMIQAFARQLPEGMRGAITLFTSGQYLGPMVDEIAYAVSKEATICLARQAAHALAFQNIQVNCINPGPIDTGYLEGDVYDKVARCFPAGRWGMPADTAKLVHFLQSDYSAWITGELIGSEGGFARHLFSDNE